MCVYTFIVFFVAMRRAMTEHAQIWRIGPVYTQHAKWAVCQECVELRLGVPGMCRGQAGLGLGKRCK